MDRLVFHAPQSFPGVLDRHIDLTLALLSTETITSVTGVSVNTDLVTLSQVQVNTSPQFNTEPVGTTAQIGKAFQWRATTVRPSLGRALLRFDIQGTEGTQLHYEIWIELAPYVRN